MPESYEFHGVRIMECAAEGAQLRTDRDATDLLSQAWAQRADLIVTPTGRLGEDFFRLSTRVAGEILQKFVNYRMRVAIAGDISRQIEESSALRGFVMEA